MEIFLKTSISIFLIFWFSVTILSYTLFYPCRSCRHSSRWHFKIWSHI